jgi:hypothetical protein
LPCGFHRIDIHTFLADLDKFSKTWTKFDPQASLVIPISELPPLLLELGSPLGSSGVKEAQLMALEMRVPIMKGGHHFTEVFAAVARSALNVESLDKEVGSIAFCVAVVVTE